MGLFDFLIEKIKDVSVEIEPIDDDSVSIKTRSGKLKAIVFTEKEIEQIDDAKKKIKVNSKK